jgi:hypothetical protein
MFCESSHHQFKPLIEAPFIQAYLGKKTQNENIYEDI